MFSGLLLAMLTGRSFYIHHPAGADLLHTEEGVEGNRSAVTEQGHQRECGIHLGSKGKGGSGMERSGSGLMEGMAGSFNKNDHAFKKPWSCQLKQIYVPPPLVLAPGGV